MTPPIIEDEAVPVVVSVHLVLWAINTVVMVFLIRASVTCMSDKAKEMKDKEEETTLCGCESRVHALANLCFVFYMMNSLSMLFITDYWFKGHNCVVVRSMILVSYICSKFTQYSFFIHRLVFVFQDSFLKVPPLTSNLLTAGNVAYLVVWSGITIASVNFNGSVVRSTNGKYIICVSDNTQRGWISAAVAWGVFCDTVLMIGVVYNFVTRLHSMASISSHTKAHVRMTRLANRTLVLFLFAMGTTYLTGVGVAIYSKNMMNLFPLNFDMCVNTITIALAFRFADPVYNKICPPCDSCVASMVAYHSRGKIVSVGTEHVKTPSPANLVATLTSGPDSPTKPTVSSSV